MGTKFFWKGTKFFWKGPNFLEKVQNFFEIVLIFFENTVAAPSPSPHISAQVSFVVEVPPDQINLDSDFRAKFNMKRRWIFKLSTWKTVKEFQNRPIGIPIDVGELQMTLFELKFDKMQKNLAQ